MCSIIFTLWYKIVTFVVTYFYILCSWPFFTFVDFYILLYDHFFHICGRFYICENFNI